MQYKQIKPKKQNFLLPCVESIVRKICSNGEKTEFPQKLYINLRYISITDSLIDEVTVSSKSNIINGVKITTVQYYLTH